MTDVATAPDSARRAREWSGVLDAMLAPFGSFALPIAHEYGLVRLLEGRRLTVRRSARRRG